MKDYDNPSPGARVLDIEFLTSPVLFMISNKTVTNL